MPVRPTIRDYGSSFGTFGGSNINDYFVSSTNIDTEKLNVNYMEDGVEFNRFEETIKDFVLARFLSESFM